MIKFGVAGNSLSFYAEGYKHTEQAAEWCKTRGIDCFEYSFGKGVRMTTEKARQIGNAFKKADVTLSIHCPYFINFANTDPLMIEKSIGYVMQSLEKIDEFNFGDRIVFHPATQGKDTRENAVERCKRNLEELAVVIADSGKYDKKICVETMGKLAQIGTLEEIVDFCNIAPFYYPCIDFGHLNARTFGSLRTKGDYEKIVEYMLNRLPVEKVVNMHVHFSKVMYGKSGEIKHLTFEDTVYGPEFSPFSEVIKDYNLTPVIICESDGTQAEDAITMKNIYLGNNK